MGDDFVLAHNQVLSNTPEDPLSDNEPKGETTTVISSDTNSYPVSEDFPSSDDGYVPAKQGHEFEADTSDANASDSDWETIDEDTSEETVDDESASDRTSEDHETSEEAPEYGNASGSKYSEPTWDEGNDLVALFSDNTDPDSVIPVQVMRAMGKMYQKHKRFELAESLLRMAQQELERIAGRLHEYTLDTVFSLATVLSHLEKLDEAGKLARRAIRGYLKVKGPGNVTTMRALREISRAYSAVCRQLLQRNPTRYSDERDEVSSHTDMYISICQELPSTDVAAMLGGLGTVLALAGHTATAKMAFQWKYASPLSRPNQWHVCNMCGQEIPSLPMYVCLTCMDFELCSSCYQSFASSNIQEESDDSSDLGSLSSLAPSNVHEESEDGSVLRSLPIRRVHDLFKIEKDGAHQVPVGDDLQTTEAFSAWLRDAAKEIQRETTTELAPNSFLLGKQEDLSMSLMRNFTTEATREFIKYEVPTSDEVNNSKTSNLQQAWFQHFIKSLPSSDLLIGSVRACLKRHIAAKILQDEDLWNSFGTLWKYNPNYLPDQQEVPSIENFVEPLMAGGRSAKNTIPNEENSLAASCLIPSHPVYGTLPLDQGVTLIRLLELLPGDTTEPLVCNLAVANMLDTLVYEAVSYTWGIDASPAHEAEVQVNSARYQVTPNLYACLLALRHRNSSRTLWVDAICINQKDDQEKSEQVARMTSIYSSASNVLVYLGDGAEADEALFRYFNRERKEGESFEASLDRLELSKPQILKPFAALCSRDWWTRVWIQQEFALPPTDPTFCLGHLRAQASPLISDVLETLQEEANKATWMALPTGYVSWNLLLKSVNCIDQAVATLGMRVRFQNGPKNLNTVLSMSPQSKCSDPRDIIFGRYIFLKPIPRAVFKPDYSLTTESLFEMVAIWLLKVEIGLELFWLYPSRLSSKSPSWVPDFTKRASEHEAPFPTTTNWKWRAEGQEDDPLDIDGGILKTHGRPLDTITHIFSVGDVPLPELVGQFLSLEHSLRVIAEQDTLQRCHPISKALPNLKAKLCPDQWSMGIAHSIYSFAPYDEISSALDEATRFVLFQFRQSHYRFQLVSIMMGGCSRAQVEGRLCGFDDAFLTLHRSFVDFDVSLRKKHLIDIFWASLTDLGNMIGQIKDLRMPRRPLSPLYQARQDVTGLMDQMMKEMQVSDVPSPMTVENDDMVEIPSSSGPHYEELQATITDCEFEEEVHLRARLVVHLANLCKSSVDADGRWIGPGSESHEQASDGKVSDRQDVSAPELEERSEKDELESVRQIASGFSHHTIFVTEQRLVGIGRTGFTDIRVGDQVVMLEKGLFPIVLRPRHLEFPMEVIESGFPFHDIVGYADIHGLDGQAFHNLPEEQKPPRGVFKVR